MTVDDIQCLIEIVCAQHGQHRAKNFVTVDLHIGRRVIEQRRSEEEALTPTQIADLAPVDDEISTFCLPFHDIRGDALEVLMRDQRPHINVGSITRAGFDRRDPRDQRVAQAVAGIADRDRDRDRHAALAR